MADYEVDKLQIEIEASSDKAAKNITKLVFSLQNLKSTLSSFEGLDKLEQKLQIFERLKTPTLKIDVDNQSVSSIDKAIDRVNALYDAIQKVNKEKLSIPKSKTIPVSKGNSYVSTVSAKSSTQIDASDSEYKNHVTDISNDAEEVSRKIGVINTAKTRIYQTSESIKNLKKSIDNSNSSFRKFAKNVANIGLDKLKNGLKSIGKISFSGFKMLGNQLVSPFKNALTAFNKWKSAIGRVAFYRAVRSAIKLITDGFKEGVENLYYYSQIMGTSFAPAMDSLASSAQYLKNSLGSIAAPLIEAVAPAIDFLIDKFVDLINVIGMAFAALSGKTTYSKALKQSATWGDDLENSMGGASKAAKEFKRYLIGIDELTVIPDQNDSSRGRGGGSGLSDDYGSMFEEVDITSGISDWAKEIRDAIEKGDWFGAGSALADKFNSILDNVPFEEWGAKLGTIIQNGISFALGFIQTFKWQDVGEGIAAFINNAIKNISGEDLGKLLSSKFKIAIDFLYGFVTELKWNDIGDFISDTIEGFFEEIDWNKAAKAFEKGVSGILSAANRILTQTDWAEISKSLSSAFTSIDWKTLGKQLSDFMTNTLESINKAIKAFDWKGVGESIADFINNINWGDLMVDLAEFIGNLLVGSLNLLYTFVAKVDWNKIGDEIYESLKEAIANIDWDGIFDYIKEIYPQKVAEFFGSIQPASLIGKAVEKEAELTETTAKSFKLIGLDGVAGFYEGIVEGLRGLAGWLQETFVDPIVNGVKKLFGIHSPSTVMAELGVYVGQGLLNGIASVFTSIGSWVKSNIFEPIQNAFNTAKDLVIEFAVNVKNEASKWWKNVKNWWGQKVGKVKEFVTEVKNNASEWWSNVQSWWKGKVGAVQEFATSVKNEAGTWWSNVKSWWADKIKDGSAQKFTTDVVNQAGQWWSNVKTWWNGVVGSVTDFVTSPKNESSSWWSNVKTWWSEKITGNSADSFTTSVKNDSGSWWSNVKNWWAGVSGSGLSTKANLNSYTNNLGTPTVNAIAKATSWNNGLGYMPTIDVKANIRAADVTQKGLTFATGGAITASGSVLRFANGGSVTGNGQANWWNSVQKYASGTRAAHGTLFVAGEAGPEIVGHVNGRTEILNKSQLASAIYSAVVSGMSNAVKALGSYLASTMIACTNALLSGGISLIPEALQSIKIQNVKEALTMPVHAQPHVYRSSDGSHAYSNGAESFSNGMRAANEDVVNVLYAVGNMIVRAVEDNGDVYLDGEDVSDNTTVWQGRKARMYGKTI